MKKAKLLKITFLSPIIFPIISFGFLAKDLTKNLANRDIVGNLLNEEIGPQELDFLRTVNMSCFCKEMRQRERQK